MGVGEKRCLTLWLVLSLPRRAPIAAWRAPYAAQPPVVNARGRHGEGMGDYPRASPRGIIPNAWAPKQAAVSRHVGNDHAGAV